jgi:hypothetical protein
MVLSTIMCSAQSSAPEVSLASAVEAFNARAKSDPVGNTQPPLTVDETVAAIRGWIRKQHPAPDEYYRAFQKIADTLSLSAGSRLDFTTGWKNYNGFDFVVWWVDFTISDPSSARPDPATTGSYTFRIRDRKISCRPAASLSGQRKRETRASGSDGDRPSEEKK